MLITASGKYPERLDCPDLTFDIWRNLGKLQYSVNGLLKDLGLAVEVSSGYRPKAVNDKVSRSKKGLHVIGLAVDLTDVSRLITNRIMDYLHLLKKHDLWMEHPSHTPTWVHLDKGTRMDREIRIFLP